MIRYLNELRAVGIITDEGKATPLAQKWRLDDTYDSAVKELIEKSYPEGLIHLAPPGQAERQKVVSWFQREGLGQGAAGNKAATYLLLSSLTPNDAPRNAAKGGQGEAAQRTRPARRQASSAPVAEGDSVGARSRGVNDAQRDPPARAGMDAFPLNINMQIHISADAGTEQIESIFQAMRRYLYDAPDT